MAKRKKYNLSAHGRKVKQEIGNQNLQAWLKDNPRRGNFKHGVSTAGLKTTRQRYTDKRTREGKVLASIIDSLVSDLGGSERLSNGQRLLLSGLETKLIVLLQISAYVDGQESIIGKQGDLLPVLQRSFIQYDESLRRSLAALYKSVKAPARVPSIEDLIARSK